MADKKNLIAHSLLKVKEMKIGWKLATKKPVIHCMPHLSQSSVDLKDASSHYPGRLFTGNRRYYRLQFDCFAQNLNPRGTIYY